MLVVEKYLIIFFIYAFLGWAMESFGGVIKTKKFVNRGFLIGPYCPVYGIGVCLLTAILSQYMNDLFVLCVMSILICGILEYLTSYLMEKIFKARWWDYHNRKFNINGRVCLETLIPFGIVGIVLIKFANPFFLQLMNFKAIVYVLILLCIIFIIDFIFSFKAILGFRKVAVIVGEEVRDNTEEITEKVKYMVMEKYNGLKINLQQTSQKLYNNIIDSRTKFVRIINKEKRKRIYANKLIRKKLKQKKWPTRRLLEAFPNLEIKLKSQKSDSEK